MTGAGNTSLIGAVGRGLDLASRVLDLAAQIAGLSMIAVLTATLFGTVVIRYLGLFTQSFDWVDETSRFLFIWMSFLGATVVSRRASHIRIGVAVDGLPERARTVITIAVEAGVIFFLAVLLAQGWIVTRQTWVQTSPSLGLPMSYVYVSLPVSAAIMLVHAARAIFMRRREEQWDPHS